jgi:hypothetical protein
VPYSPCANRNSLQTNGRCQGRMCRSGAATPASIARIRTANRRPAGGAFDGISSVVDVQRGPVISARWRSSPASCSG